MKIFAFLLLIPILNFGQLSPKVNKLYQKLSANDKVESQYAGDFFGENPAYRCFLEINDIATDKEVEYMAYHGNPVVKTYASKIIFKRKLKSLDELFKYYLKNNNPVIVIEGCMVDDSFLVDELYKSAFNEKGKIENITWYKKHEDSIIKNGGEPFDATHEWNQTTWTKDEINSLLETFEQNILDKNSSSKRLVEMIAEFNFYTETKSPYFQKFIYFDEKYNSEMIKKYIEFCSK